MNFLKRFFALSLYAYPKDFRVRFGAQMVQAFADQCRDFRGSVPKLYARTFYDWLTSLARERKPKARGFVAEWSLTLLLYLFVSTTLVQAYVIPTGSMEGSLKIGDHILVDRLTYAQPGVLGHSIFPYRDPQRGDIVAFRYPEDLRQTYVKRVIGVPGDRVHLENKQVFRNGVALTESYAQHVATDRDPYRDDFPVAPGALTTPLGTAMFRDHVHNGEVTVPPEMLFVMGDNRENSADSRYWGFVPRANVVGRPVVVFWSYDAPTSELQEWNVAHFADLFQHFFTRTRWDRTFKVPQ